MSDSRRGARPRPRALLLGSFEEPERDAFKAFFPTLWEAENPMYAEVSPQEIDVVVIGDISGKDSKIHPKWTQQHVICFANDPRIHLPGTYRLLEVGLDRNAATTEEFRFDDLPLPLDRLRRADLAGVRSTGGWSFVEQDYVVLYGPVPAEEEMLVEKSRKGFDEGVIIQLTAARPASAQSGHPR